MGFKGKKLPSAIGANPISGESHFPLAIIVCFIADASEVICLWSSISKSSIFIPLSFAVLRNNSPHWFPLSLSKYAFIPPLWQIALENKLPFGLIEDCNATLQAPADSPKIVMFSGSPPNSAMFSFTHSIANFWSIKPSLPVDLIAPFETSSSFKNPNGPRR